LVRNESIVFPLLRTHETEEFDCGKPALDAWLHHHAFQAERSKSARTYVVCIESNVIAYYSLVVGEIPNSSISRLTKGLSRHPVPIIKLARLAIDNRHKGRGLGRLLLIDALQRSLQVSKIVGARAVLVDPLDREAHTFYERFGFEMLNQKTGSPMGSRFILVKDLEKLLLPAG
jgi:GNAT superfamily N-acetyltransferase